MEKSCAIEVRQLTLQAIENLSKILFVAEDGYSDAEYADLKLAVASILGESLGLILVPIYNQYPDLNHLKDK